MPPDHHAAEERAAGGICSVRIETFKSPVMQKIRYMDKLVDEPAKGPPMVKILRS